jgi:hypothetical protein
MGKLILKLQRDANGKRGIIVNYESDVDALPIEHEDEHRRLVDKVIENGGLVTVERDQPAQSQDQLPGEEATTAREVSQKS